jgi:hypothetical protein
MRDFRRSVGARRWRLGALLTTMALVGSLGAVGRALPSGATLQLVKPTPSAVATFSGHGGYSADGLGQEGTGGTVQADVPAGSTVVQAYLYGTYNSDPAPLVADRTIDFDGTTVVLDTLANSEPGNSGLSTARADVTAQVKTKIGSAGGIRNFAVNTDPAPLDGVALVVVYSNPASPQVTIAVLDGGSKQAGDQETLDFASAIHPAAAGFSAVMSLGSGFSYQGVDGHACGGSQFSTVVVNGAPLTSCAGNYDDGLGADGALITVGGVGDSTDNPADGTATNSGTDDELYNLTPFLHDGDTSMVINTANPSSDDNLFLSVISITAQATVTTEICNDGIDNDGDGLIDNADPDCFPKLAVSKLGTGSGTVSSNPTGIDCGATCIAPFASGTHVTLTESPAAGSTFAGWSGGGCSGTATTCQVTVTADTSVTATFNPSGPPPNPTLTVTKSGSGSGTVSSSPSGIDCGATCSAQFTSGTAVTLTESPAAGSTFTGWSGGGCSGTATTCQVTVTADTSVTATFTVPTQHGITITPSATPKTMTGGNVAKTHFTIRNTNSSTIHGIAATVKLPTGATPVSISTSSGACSSFTNGQATCLYGSIAAGGTRGIDVTFTTPTGGTGPFLVVVNATSSDAGAATASGGPTLVASKPGFARGFVPPGGSISTGTDPTAANPIVATFELPNTGSGAPITLRTESAGANTFCGGHPCAGGKILFLSPFTGYNDPTRPPELKIKWDTSIVGTSTTFAIYVQKVENGPIVTIPNCRNYGSEDLPDIADPHPCVELRKVHSNGDAEAHIFLLSGDPRIAR